MEDTERPTVSETDTHSVKHQADGRWDYCSGSESVPSDSSFTGYDPRCLLFCWSCHVRTDLPPSAFNSWRVAGTKMAHKHLHVAFFRARISSHLNAPFLGLWVSVAVPIVGSSPGALFASTFSQGGRGRLLDNNTFTIHQRNPRREVCHAQLSVGPNLTIICNGSCLTVAFVFTIYNLIFWLRQTVIFRGKRTDTILHTARTKSSSNPVEGSWFSTSSYTSQSLLRQVENIHPEKDLHPRTLVSALVTGKIQKASLLSLKWCSTPLTMRFSFSMLIRVHFRLSELQRQTGDCELRETVVRTIEKVQYFYSQSNSNHTKEYYICRRNMEYVKC